MKILRVRAEAVIIHFAFATETAFSYYFDYVLCIPYEKEGNVYNRSSRVTYFIPHDMYVSVNRSLERGQLLL